MQTFRYLKRDKVFSWINLGGLAIGLTAVLYIALYIWQESHYDDFHKNVENLYRLSISMEQNGKVLGNGPEFLDPLAPAMKAEIPEIEAATRFGGRSSFNVQYDEKLLKIEHVCYADTGFLEMFNFPLLIGNAKTALTAPFTIVITDKLAENLFGKDDPLGKVIKADGTRLYTITGVLRTPPANTQFKFDALASFSTLYRLPDRWMGWNGGNQYTALVRLNRQSSVESVTEKTNRVIWENIGRMYAEAGFEIKGSLQAIRNVHLYYDYASKTLRTNLSIFAVVAFLILMVAGINFVNLTVARSLRRIKEAGVRKLLGESRLGLVKMFLGESLLVCCVAFVLALLLYKLFEPLYIQISGTIMSGTVFSVGLIVGGIFTLAVLIGVIAGSYPAFRLSSLPLADAAKGGGKQKKEKHGAQNILVVIQFAISVALIVCTLVVSGQLSYINSKDTGFDRNRIINLSMTGNAVRDREPILKTQLKNLSGIVDVASSSGVPVGGFSGNGYLPEGMENVMMINLLSTDDHFLDVYGIKLREGRFFGDGEADRSAFVINESLVKTLGWENEAIGKYIARDGRHEIIGIVRDFNYESLYSEIKPLIIANRSDDASLNVISVKYNTGDVAALIGRIRDVWTEVNPDAPFEYYFLDDLYNSSYKSEQQFRLLFFSFAFIAIVLAVLGMLGLMAYTIEQRRKEIGIRRVLGASIFDVLKLLLRKTAIQVFIANLTAWPMAWWLMHRWLEDFAYRIQIGWTIFALALFISVFIALMSVAFQAVRAATANPVKAIKSE